MPRIELHFQLVTPVVEASIEQRVRCELLLGLFDDAFASQRYQMQLAGSDITLNIDSTRGLELAVSGYSDSVGVVLKRALSMLTELMASELGRLDFVRQHLLRSLQDDYTSQAAYQHAVESARLWLMPHRYAPLDKISMLRNVTAPNVKTFSASLVSSLFLTSMAYGNVNKSDAIGWTQEVASNLGFAPRSKADHPRWPVVKLRAGVTHLVQLRTVQKEDENNVIFSFYQVGPVTDRGATLHLMLLASVMKEPCFDTLRTKQGLGYTVFSGVLEMRGVAGFYVLAQGAAMDASRMDDAAHAFVQDFESTLKAMSKADVATYIEALQGELEQSPLSLDEAAADAWGEIATGQYRFDHVERDIATLNSITKISLLAFYREHLAAAGTSFRRLNVEVFGKGDTTRLPVHATPNNTVLLTVDGGEDVLGWQAAQDDFPLVWGVNTR
jgi:insulysin